MRLSGDYKDYTGSFRISKKDAEVALEFARLKDWSVSKLIRQSLQSYIAAEKQAKTDNRRTA
jgi:hypothetical protein